MNFYTIACNGSAIFAFRLNLKLGGKNGFKTSKNGVEMQLNEIIESEELHLKHLNDLVSEAIREEKLLTTKLAELEMDQTMTTGQKIADKVAEIGGSWIFISWFGVFLVVWILINVLFLTNKAFDPYPFILLNLILSCIAALQAPVIMMSQNRQDEKDRRRSRGDYLVNMKAEMEIRSLNQKIDLLLKEEMQSLFEIQRAQIKILTKIEKRLEEKNI